MFINLDSNAFSSDSLPQNFPFPNSASYASGAGASYGGGYYPLAFAAGAAPLRPIHHLTTTTKFSRPRPIHHLTTTTKFSRPTFAPAIEAEAAEVDGDIQPLEESSSSATTEKEEQEGTHKQ